MQRPFVDRPFTDGHFIDGPSVAGPFVDGEGLRSYLGPGGGWAQGCGSRVRERRHQLGLEVQQLAGLTGTSNGTISRVELGRLVPREWLKAAIAGALGVEVVQLWPPPRRVELGSSS